MSEADPRTEHGQVVLSRARIQAVVAAVLVVTVTAFGVGFSIGRTLAPAAARRPVARVLDDVPKDGLVELLAEVERGQKFRASAAIQYPEMVDGNGVPHVPQTEPLVAGAGAAVAAPQAIDLPVGDAPVAGAFAVALPDMVRQEDAAALRDVLTGAGLAAWSSANQVEGETRWSVHVGGYASELAATEALASVRALAGASGAGARVVATQP